MPAAGSAARARKKGVSLPKLQVPREDDVVVISRGKSSDVLFILHFVKLLKSCVSHVKAFFLGVGGNPA